MKYLSLLTKFPLQPRDSNPTLSRLFVLFVSLLSACNLSPPSELERTQADNIQLTKTLHACLNQRDWQSAEKLCAKTIRYRGRTTHFAEVEESKAQFLTHYRSPQRHKPPTSIEIRQLYPAGAYHVIVEGVVSGAPSDTIQAICLIYTIEDQHITRLYEY